MIFTFTGTSLCLPGGNRVFYPYDHLNEIGWVLQFDDDQAKEEIEVELQLKLAVKRKVAS